MKPAVAIRMPGRNAAPALQYLFVIITSSFLSLVSIGQNVGIGTSSPGQKLDVAGNIKLDNNIMVEGMSSFRVYRNLASYAYDGGPLAGAFVIHTNQPYSNSEWSMTIKGYEFTMYGLFEVTLGGYSGAQGYIWEGDFKLQVRTGYDASEKLVVILGDAATAYAYPKLTVTEFRQSYANIEESYADGWYITQETSLATYSAVNTVPDVSDRQWMENGSDLYFTEGGVGIGVTDPTYKLHVYSTNGNAYGDVVHVLNDATNPNPYMTGLYAESRSTATSNPGAAVYGYHNNTSGNSAGVTGESRSASGRGIYGKASSSSGTNYGVYGETLSTTDGYGGYFVGPRNYFSGKIGIGTETPLREIHVFGNTEPAVRVKGFASPGIEVINIIDLNTNVGWKMLVDDQGDCNFMPSLNEFTTSPNDGYRMIFSATGSGEGFVPIVDDTKSLGNLSHRWTAVFAQNGTIQTSDISDKDDILPMTYGLNEVLRLNPVSFRWKDEPGGPKRLGLIAQEVEPVMPEVVLREFDDKKGRDVYGMNYSELIPVLVKAIQEQQEQIRALEEKIQELER